MIRHPRGFTLLEMLIASAIALIIFGIGFVTIDAITKSRRQVESTIRASENARQFFQMLEQDLKAAYPALAVANKAQMVEFEAFAIPGTGIKSDALRCYTRVDRYQGNLNPDGHNGVRYFVNSRNQLCRAFDVNGILATDYNATDSAMFERVRKLEVSFWRWDSQARSFVNQQTDATNATHLRVLIQFNQSIGRVSSTDTTLNQAEQTRINDAGAIQAFSKVLPIPQGYRQ